jgi:hypothetical protein
MSPLKDPARFRHDRRPRSHLNPSQEPFPRPHSSSRATQDPPVTPLAKAPTAALFATDRPGSVRSWPQRWFAVAHAAPPTAPTPDAADHGGRTPANGADRHGDRASDGDPLQQAPQMRPRDLTTDFACRQSWPMQIVPARSKLLMGSPLTVVGATAFDSVDFEESDCSCPAGGVFVQQPLAWAWGVIMRTPLRPRSEAS